MCLIIMGLTACEKADPTQVDYNGYTYDQLKEQCQGTALALESMTDEEAETYKTTGEEMLVNMVTSWQEASEDTGEYTELGEFTITDSGKSISCEQEIIYEERPVILTFVYRAYDMQLEDITVNRVETLGEKMESATLNTLMGMGTVFSVLVLISLIIFGFKVFPYLEKKKLEKKAATAPSTEIPVAETVVDAVQDNQEIVAVISAAIAASTGTSTDDFVVRSIKRRF